MSESEQKVSDEKIWAVAEPTERAADVKAGKKKSSSDNKKVVSASAGDDSKDEQTQVVFANPVFTSHRVTLFEQLFNQQKLQQHEKCMHVWVAGSRYCLCG